MENNTQPKLTCYAVSAAALNLLDPKTGGTLPDFWFNWKNGAISRLTFVPGSWSKGDIVLWERNTRNEGYDTHLVLGPKDTWSDGDLFDFSNPKKSVSFDMILSRVNPFPFSKETNLRLLDNLRWPDVFLSSSFTRLRRGGGVNLSETAYKSISANQWWMFACEFKRWASLMYPAEATAPHPDRPEMYDLNKWDVYRRRPGNPGIFKVPDTQLTLVEFFEKDCNSGLVAVKNGIGSLDKPWSAETLGEDMSAWSLQALPEVKTDASGVMPKVVKVYPLRQAPICGVAVLDNGQILPYGGFASLIPEHQWAWDSGEVLSVIRAKNFFLRLKTFNIS